MLKQVGDNDDCFEIVSAFHPHRVEEIRENVMARSLLFYGPDIDAALHLTYDECAPALFHADRDKIRTPIANERMVTTRCGERWFVEDER